jgi:hypothetical protein
VLQALQVLEGLVLPSTDKLDVKDKLAVRGGCSSSGIDS